MTSLASNTPHIPQELVNLIIDELCDTPDALKATGLVNTRFYFRTRRYLFKEICIEGEEPEARINRLINVLKSKPVLQACVHKLELDNDTTLEDSKGWIVNSPSAAARVVELLPLTPALTKLYLTGGSKGLSWLDIPIALQRGLLDVMARSMLQKLDLDTISDLSVEAIAEFNKLEWLTINILEYKKLVLKSRGQPQALQSPATGPALGDPRLGTLRVAMSGDVWKEIMWYATNTPHARHLLYPRVLCLDLMDWDEEMVGAWRDFLELSAPYVEVLDMCFDAFEPLHDRTSILYPSAALNFTRFTNLEDLVFRCYSRYLYAPECNPFPDFLDALEATARSNSTPFTGLQTITIVFTFDKDSESGTPHAFDLSHFMCDFSVDECWSRLCDIILLDAFENLRNDGAILISFDFDDEDLEAEEWLSAKADIDDALEDIADVVDVVRNGEL